MNTRLWRWIVPALFILVPLFSYAAGKPEITRLDTEFLDNKVNIRVHWQSPNPVVLLKVLAGREQKEIKIDEYDNKRNPRGFSGEATVVLDVEPRPGLDFITYVIYLEDDLNRKSDQRTGKVKVPQAFMAAQPGAPPPGVPMGMPMGAQPGAPFGMPPGTPPGPPPGVQVGVQVGAPPGAPPGMPGAPMPPPGVQVGVQVGAPPGAPPGMPGAPMAPPPGMPGAPPGPPPGMDAPQPGLQIGAQPGGVSIQSSGSMIDKVVSVMERHDTPPYLHDIKVNPFEGNNVTISTKANDDKGLREITFRIFDAAGNQVQDQTLSNLGKIWQGTTKPFNLPPGKYKVVARAVDTGGNTSEERSATFTVTGQPGQYVPPVSAAPPMPAAPVASGNFLTVFIAPQEAVNAGAQWRAGGGDWQNSGATVSGFPAGQQVIEFKDLLGWAKPANQVLTIQEGQPATASGAYMPTSNVPAAPPTPQPSTESRPK